MKFTIVYATVLCIIATEGDEICSTSRRKVDPTCPTDCSQNDTRVHGETSIFNCTIGGEEYVKRYKRIYPNYFQHDTELIFEAPTLLNIQLYSRNKEPSLKVNFLIAKGVEPKYLNEIVYPEAVLMTFESIFDEPYKDLYYANCRKDVIFRFHEYSPTSSFDALHPRNISYDCLVGLDVTAERQLRVYKLVLQTVRGQSATYMVTVNVVVDLLEPALWQTVIATHVDEERRSVYIVFQKLFKSHVYGYVVELFNGESVVEKINLPSINNTALFTNLKAGKYSVTVSVISKMCPSACMTTRSYVLDMPRDRDFGEDYVKIGVMVIGCLVGVFLVLLLGFGWYKLHKSKMEPSQGWIIHPFKRGTDKYDVFKKLKEAVGDVCHCKVLEYVPEEWNESTEKATIEKHCEHILEKRIKFVIIVHSERANTMNEECSFNNYYSYAISEAREKAKNRKFKFFVVKFSFSQKSLPQILKDYKLYHLMDEFCDVCTEIRNVCCYKETSLEPLLNCDNDRIQALKQAIDAVTTQLQMSNGKVETGSQNTSENISANIRPEQSKGSVIINKRETDVIEIPNQIQDSQEAVNNHNGSKLISPYVRMSSIESAVINDFRIFASQVNQSSASEDDSVSDISVSRSKENLCDVDPTAMAVGSTSHKLLMVSGMRQDIKSDYVKVNDMPNDECSTVEDYVHPYLDEASCLQASLSLLPSHSILPSPSVLPSPNKDLFSQSQHSKTIENGYIPHVAIHDNFEEPIVRPKQFEYVKNEQESIYIDKDLGKSPKKPTIGQDKRNKMTRQLSNVSTNQDYVVEADCIPLQTYCVNNEARDDSGIDSLQQNLNLDLRQSREGKSDKKYKGIYEDFVDNDTFTDIPINSQLMTGGRCYGRKPDSETHINRDYFLTNKNQTGGNNNPDVYIQNNHCHPSVLQDYHTHQVDNHQANNHITGSLSKPRNYSLEQAAVTRFVKKTDDILMVPKPRNIDWNQADIPEVSDTHYRKPHEQNEHNIVYIHHDDVEQRYLPNLEPSVNQGYVNPPHHYYQHEQCKPTSISEYDDYQTGSKHQYLQQTGSQQPYKQTYSQQPYQQTGSQQPHSMLFPQIPMIGSELLPDRKELGTEHLHLRTKCLNTFYQQPYELSGSQQTYDQIGAHQPFSHTGSHKQCLQTQSNGHETYDSGHFEPITAGYVLLPNSNLKNETSFNEHEKFFVPSNISKSNASSSGYVTNIEAKQRSELSQSLLKNAISSMAVDPEIDEQNSDGFDNENLYIQIDEDFESFDPIPPEEDDSPDGSISDTMEKMEKLNLYNSNSEDSG